MSLVVQTIDYGPLYNALQGQRTGRMAKLQADNTRLGELQGLEGIVLDAATGIMGIVKDAKIADAKVDVQNFEQAAQQKARDYILNNNFTVQDAATETAAANRATTNYDQYATEPAGSESKTIKLPDEYDQWYKDSLEQINQKYAGFPEVRNWASDQLYQTYDSAKKTALNTFYQKTLDDRAKQEQVLITNSLQDSIAREDFSFTEAALRSARSLTPTEKETARTALEGQFNYGVKSAGVQKAATEGGVDPAMAMIDTWSKDKKVTAEEEDNLRKEAINGANLAAGLWQSRADSAFNAAIDKGQDAELAVKQSLAAVPEAFKSKAESVLRSDYQNHVSQVDDVADKEMLQYYDANPANGAGLYRALHDPKNNYAKRMSTNTYTFWENMAERIMKPEKGDGTTLQAQSQLDDILRGRPGMLDTPQSKVQAIQELAHQKDPRTGEFIIATATLNKYLEMAKDPTYYRPEVMNGWDRIKTVVEAAARKKGTNPMPDLQAAQDEFTRRLAGFKSSTKQPSTTDIDDLVDSILQPHKSAILYENQVDRLNARAEARALRAKASTAGAGFYLNEDEQARLATRDRATFEQVYGVGGGDKPLLATAADNRGIPVFKVAGLDPAHPKDAFWYQIATDAQGNEVLTGYDKSGNWIPIDIKSQAKLREEGARKSQAEQEQLRQQVKSQAPTTAEQVNQTAAQLGITSADVAIKKEQDNPSFTQDLRDRINMRLQLSGILRRGTMTAQEVRDVAAALKGGVTESMVMAFAAGRGIKLE